MLKMIRTTLLVGALTARALVAQETTGTADPYKGVADRRAPGMTADKHAKQGSG